MPISALIQQATEQSVEVLRRRLFSVSRFATVEPTGSGRFIVHAPGVNNIAQIEPLFTIPAKLTFHLIRESRDGRVPAGAMWVQPHPLFGVAPEIVERRPRLTGEHLERVTPATDSQTGEFALSFKLDSEGTRVFCRLTSEHLGERFAILLDNQVLTAPRINERICGGSGMISGSMSARDVHELATLLVAGTLPAPLSVINVRGPNDSALPN